MLMNGTSTDRRCSNLTRRSLPFKRLSFQISLKTLASVADSGQESTKMFVLVSVMTHADTQCSIFNANIQDIADTSDAAYEKRHRKYETFEKRQRLREKEKLKHEQYKLKERMEQLRAMDGSAFLALPSSSFSPIPSVAP